MTKPEREIVEKVIRYCTVRRQKEGQRHGGHGELGHGAVGQVLRADGPRPQRHRLPRELRRQVRSIELYRVLYLVKEYLLLT